MISTLRKLSVKERESLEKEWFHNWIWIQDWNRWYMIHNHVRSFGYDCLSESSISSGY